MSGVPTPVARFLLFMLGPGYAWVLAVTLAQATGQELQTTIASVTLGSLALMFVLLRMSMAEHKNERTTIEKLMWITAALCIYLAYLGQLFSKSEFEFEIQNMLLVVITSFFFIMLSTAIALNFLDTSLVILNYAFTSLKRISRR